MVYTVIDLRDFGVSTYRDLTAISADFDLSYRGMLDHFKNEKRYGKYPFIVVRNEIIKSNRGQG